MSPEAAVSPEKDRLPSSRELFVRLASLLVRHGHEIDSVRAAQGEHLFGLHSRSTVHSSAEPVLAKGPIKEIDFCPSFTLDGEPTSHRLTVTFRDPDLHRAVVLELEPNAEQPTSYTEARPRLTLPLVEGRNVEDVVAPRQETLPQDMLTIYDALRVLEDQYGKPEGTLA